jgi:hypothetical protein
MAPLSLVIHAMRLRKKLVCQGRGASAGKKPIYQVLADPKWLSFGVVEGSSLTSA